MSKNYNDCDIVLDLLPLYLDGKAGNESNAFVETHLAECAECREVHRLMSAEITQRMPSCDEGASLHTAKKKSRKRKQFARTTGRIIILLVGLIGYVCLMAGVVAAVFLFLTSG